MPKLSTVKFLPPVIKPDVEVKDEIPPTVDDLKESNAGTEDQEGELTLDNIIVVDEAKEEIIEEKEEILTWVEEMPEFKGDLGKFIGERLNYPSEAKKELIEGDVWVEFIVNKDGSLTKFKVLKSLGHGCDEEALRVIKQMPSWKPGMQNGKPATTKKKMKISFRFSS